MTLVASSCPTQQGVLCTVRVALRSPMSGWASGPCGAQLVCTQAVEGETMRLFLPLCGATISTLRALMGWLPWEPEAANPMPQSMRLLTADGYSALLPAGLDRRSCAFHQVFQSLTKHRH